MNRGLSNVLLAVAVLLIVHVAHTLPPIADAAISTLAILVAVQVFFGSFRWRDIPVLAVTIALWSWLLAQPVFNTDAAVGAQWVFIAAMMTIACIQAIRRTS